MRISKAVVLIAVLALLGATPAPRFLRTSVDFETLRGHDAFAKVKALKPSTSVKVGSRSIPAFVLSKYLMAGRQRRLQAKRTYNLRGLAQRVIVPKSAFGGTATVRYANVSKFTTADLLVYDQTVKIPPQQTGPTDLNYANTPCVTTICAVFGDGHDVSHVVSAGDYTPGSIDCGSIGGCSLWKNPDGSYSKAPDGECLFGPQATDESGQPIGQSEVACPGVTIQVPTFLCKYTCAPQHSKLTIRDTFLFDHYAAACDKGFKIDVQLGSDDGVAHTLYIDVGYPDPSANAAGGWPTCTVDVFIKGPSGSDWNLS